MRPFLLAQLCALLSITASTAVAEHHVGPSARDIVEFERIVQPERQSDDVMNDQVSPDGTQAFVLTRKSDVSSDKNVYKIQLLDVMPDHLAAQRAPNPVTVFSAGISQDNHFGHPGVQDVHWHDARTLVFLARLHSLSFQVYRLDVRTRSLVQLTRAKDLITAYAASADLKKVVYTVQVPNPPLRKGEHGVVVETRSFWDVKFGQNELLVQDGKYQHFVAYPGSSRPPRALGPEFVALGGAQFAVSISPDGRWALLPRYEPERLAGWATRYTALGALVKRFDWSSQADPLQYFSRSSRVVPRRMMAWRLDDGAVQTIVDAPEEWYEGVAGGRERRLWQGKGASVVLVGTYLPPGRDATISPRSHVIEYWPDSGRWVDIATMDDQLKGARRLDDGFVVFDGIKRREFRRQPNGGWTETAAEARQATPKSAWTLRVIQGLNQPPDVYASGPSGQITRLTSLNPQFETDTWGKMQTYGWTDSSGRRWDGGLMSTSDSDAHARRPLLIQTYGFVPDRFYLDGPNLDDAFSSGFAGRAFLRDGILVLAMPWSPRGGFPPQERQAFQAFYEGVHGAIDTLVKEGRVDPTKVGIMGWSATGERVLNLLTFSDVPIRAATTADGDTNTLFMYTLNYGWFGSGIWDRLEELNGGPPYGATLSNWVRDDPALHTDCVHTALRIESYEPGVKPNWDTYALLRRQYKPVEMIVLPGAGHSLLTPGDRMLSLQGNVDWYGFWLAGRTRTTPVTAAESAETLAAQYARWQQMAVLKTADDARPMCVR